MATPAKRKPSGGLIVGLVIGLVGLVLDGTAAVGILAAISIPA